MKRRLGVVSTSFPRDDADPAGRFVLTNLRAKREQEDLEVHVVAIGAGPCESELEGIAVTRVGSRGLFDAEGAPEVWERARGLTSLHVRLEAARVTAALSQSVRTNAPLWDAVESHWLVPSALAVAQGAPGLFHTAYAHSGDVAWLETAPGGAALARWLVRRLNAVVCVSSALAERLERLVRLWPSDVALRVQAMPADPRWFAPGPALTPERLVVGVGRLVPIKGFDQLLFAVAGLPAAHRPAVAILGEGPERGRLARLAELLGVRLRLPGAVSPAEVAAWLRRATAFVQPSRVLPNGRGEGAPVAVREALALGTLVIATSAGDIRHDAPGFVEVPPNDVTALRGALGSALRTHDPKSA